MPWWSNRWLVIGEDTAVVATMRMASMAPPRTMARCTTGRAPRPFARRAAIARATSCSSGMKTPGPAMNPRIQSAARSEY